ncbi:MAG TPA: cobyric acid synthase [Streptosporangiaceae bacterium]|nr:cobyric acid synthase [Streptosporangiaceae bacterium]
MKGLLVAGTASDAGKSVVAAGLCRWLARQGLKVAPFKGQNMSLNSVVTHDGAEIGRAQAMQAAAAGAEPEAAMNPVLLKPGGDGRSQVMVLGEPVADADALGYRNLKPRLRETALSCLADLAARFDVVVCEGAGSPAEVNLREADFANMGLARAAGLPAVVVADIDRGGAIAGLFGTLALLGAEDQALVSGFVINKFRGDPRLLAPGLDTLADLTGRPTLGVLPWQPGLWVDAEDSLSLPAAGMTGSGGPAASSPGAARDPLRVAVVRLPHISNFTDTDPLAAEPGVAVRFVTSAAEVADADLVILPGSRATVADLAWLRERGLAAAIAERAARARPVLGICGGYQMLATEIHDNVESKAGVVPGLALLPAVARFGQAKVLRQCSGTAFGWPVTGYEIHHGVVATTAATPAQTVAPQATAGQHSPFPGGCAVAAVRGTTWHGLLESDGFRRELLSQVAAETGQSFTPTAVCFHDVRERQLDTLGDLVANHLDTAALMDLIEHGPTPGLPFIPPGAP